MKKYNSLRKEYLIIFVISVVMGLLGQTIIPMLSYKLNLKHFSFDNLIANIDIYTFVIVFLICYKNPKPLNCFIRIIIYFSGLCLGYYGYTSSLDVYYAITSGNNGYLGNIIYDLLDAFSWIILSVFAGIWGYIMIKNENKKYLFCLMTIPFILVSIYNFYWNLKYDPMEILMAIVDILAVIGIVICTKRRIQ